MLRNLAGGVVIACAVMFGFATDTHAQASNEAKQAGQEAKQAGKAAGEAGKDARKATADAAKATGHATKTAAKKVTPETTSAHCNDGTVEMGKTKTTACIDHGGVKD